MLAKHSQLTLVLRRTQRQCRSSILKQRRLDARTASVYLAASKEQALGAHCREGACCAGGGAAAGGYGWWCRLVAGGIAVVLLAGVATAASAVCASQCVISRNCVSVFSVRAFVHPLCGNCLFPGLHNDEDQCCEEC